MEKENKNGILKGSHLGLVGKSTMDDVSFSGHWMKEIWNKPFWSLFAVKEVSMSLSTQDTHTQQRTKESGELYRREERERVRERVCVVGQWSKGMERTRGSLIERRERCEVSFYRVREGFNCGWKLQHLIIIIINLWLIKPKKESQLTVTWGFVPMEILNIKCIWFVKNSFIAPIFIQVFFFLSFFIQVNM